MGDSVLFWYDAWVFLGSSTPLRERFQRLFSFVIDDKVSVREVLSTPNMADLFHLPLSLEAMDELNVVQSGLFDLHADTQIPDYWSWTPGKGSYTTKSYYTLAHANLPDASCMLLFIYRACPVLCKCSAELRLVFHLF